MLENRFRETGRLLRRVRVRGVSVMAVPLERRVPGAPGGSARRRTPVEVPVEVQGSHVRVAGRELDGRRIRSVAVVHRPGRALFTWGPALVAGLVVAIGLYVVLVRLLPGPAGHPVGVLIFLLVALAAGLRAGIAVRHLSVRAFPTTYRLRVDVDGSIVTVAEGTDFAALKRAESAILGSLGDV